MGGAKKNDQLNLSGEDSRIMEIAGRGLRSALQWLGPEPAFGNHYIGDGMFARMVRKRQGLMQFGNERPQHQTFECTLIGDYREHVPYHYWSTSP